MADSFMTFRQLHLPYCVQRLKDGRYIVLNRRYKPIGSASDAFVDYDTHPSATRFKGLTPLRASKISYKGAVDLEVIYLYNDGCIPDESKANWAAYCKRLEVLMKIEVELHR